ncbi:MAG: DNA-formamidopyrimidine glycosylase family protein [Chloroflexota bacterium]
MPELPEIFNLARQMKNELVGKKIVGIEVLQPKSLNVSKDVFVRALVGGRVWLKRYTMASNPVLIREAHFTRQTCMVSEEGSRWRTS